MKWFKTQKASRTAIIFLTTFSYIENQKTMQKVFWSHSIALLHRYANTFCYKASDLKSQNIPDVPDFWLVNKIFCDSLCGYAFMLYHIISLISASLPILTWIISYPPFAYIFYDECSKDVTGEYSSAKYQWRNWWGTLSAVAPSSRERYPF